MPSDLATGNSIPVQQMCSAKKELKSMQPVHRTSQQSEWQLMRDQGTQIISNKGLPVPPHHSSLFILEMGDLSSLLHSENFSSRQGKFRAGCQHWAGLEPCAGELAAESTANGLRRRLHRKEGWPHPSHRQPEPLCTEEPGLHCACTDFILGTHWHMATDNTAKDTQPGAPTRDTGSTTTSSATTLNSCYYDLLHFRSLHWMYSNQPMTAVQ